MRSRNIATVTTSTQLNAGNAGSAQKESSFSADSAVGTSVLQFLLSHLKTIRPDHHADSSFDDQYSGDTSGRYYIGKIKYF